MPSCFVHPKVQVDPASALCEDTRVAADCQVGPEVRTFVCFTLGAGSRLYQQIRIGHRVHIGPNVTRVGPLTILEDVQIAANASVAWSFPGPAAWQRGKSVKGRSLAVTPASRVCNRTASMPGSSPQPS